MTAFLIPATILTAIYVLTIALFLYGLSRPAPGRNDEKPSVSVIIAARNEEHHIGAILQDLAIQSYPAESYEVIVANDASSDRTIHIINDFAERYPSFRSITINDCPPGVSPKKYAIEQAVRKSIGKIILATDADCRVGPDWIASMVAFFTPSVGFVVGFSQFGRSGDPQNLIERLQAFDFLPLMGVAAATCQLGLPLAASGQNLAYRRDAFLSVGGYRRVYHRISGDDVLLLQLIRRLTRYRTVFALDDKAFASSEPQSTLSQFINQRKRWASNGSFQLFLNLPFFFYLILVYLYNSLCFFGSLAAIFSPSLLVPLLWLLAIKLASEGLMSSASARRFHRIDLLKYFPLWFFLQIPYVALMGVLGTFGNFKWKGRTHSATA